MMPQPTPKANCAGNNQMVLSVAMLMMQNVIERSQAIQAFLMFFRKSS